MGGFFNRVLLPVLTTGASIAGGVVGGPAGFALGAIPAAALLTKGIITKNPLDILGGAVSGATGGLGGLGAGIGSTVGSAAAAGAGAGIGNAIGQTAARLGSTLGASLGSVGKSKNTLSDVLGGAESLLNTGLGIYGSLNSKKSVRPFSLSDAQLNLGPAGGTSSASLPNIPNISQLDPGGVPNYELSLPKNNTSDLLQLLGAFRT